MTRQFGAIPEAQRLETLHGFASASEPNDELFDRVTEIVARIFEVPVALITLVDEHVQHFKSTFGSRPSDTSRAFAFCDYTIRGGEPFVVPDALQDPRFRDNPHVTPENGLRFYAGSPLVAADGARIGALCIIDSVPRTIEPARLALLDHLAALVVPLLELRLETQRAIEVQNELSAVIDASPNAIITRGSDGVIWGWNDAATRIFGYERHEAVGQLANLATEPYLPIVTDVLRRVESNGDFVEGVVVQAEHKDGRLLDVEFSAKGVKDSNGKPNGAVYVVEDITRQMRQSNIERRRYAILELAAQSAPLPTILDGLIDLIEASVPETIGTILRVEDGRVYHAASSAAMPPEFGRAIDGAAIGPNEGSCGTAAFSNETVIVTDIEHDPRWENYRALALPLGLRSCWSTPIVSEGRVIGTLAFYARTVRAPSETDLRYLREAGHVASIAMAAHEGRARLEAMALSDALTALPNRVGFERELSTRLARANLLGKGVVVGLLGLDRFKKINDSLGHAIGDLLLKEIAARLRRAAPAGVLLARIGSDEFAFCAEFAERGDASDLASTFANALTEGFVPEDDEIFVRGTTGFAIYPDDERDASQLIALAHSAMRGAKARNESVGFHSGGQTREGRRRLTLEGNLWRAIEHGELEVNYQPVVTLASGIVTGAEALLRWNNPHLGRVGPNEFIPIAEETGSIVPIGAWVLLEACRFARTWLDSGGPGTVAVNVSARQFEAGDFAAVVVDTLEKTGLPPDNLTLEITESLILRAPELVYDTIARLRGLGVRCAIDDFGTGQSSLTRLMRFPFDAVKIDRSFLTDIGKPFGAGGDELFVRAIVNVGLSMGLSVIAEGVETEAQRELLVSTGCDSAQGFLFARPMSAIDLLGRVAARGRR